MKRWNHGTPSLSFLNEFTPIIPKQIQIERNSGMKVIYYPEEDTLSILLRNVPIAESSEGKSGVILDFDREGNVVGMEILDASKRMDNPRALDYAVMS